MQHQRALAEPCLGLLVLEHSVEELGDVGVVDVLHEVADDVLLGFAQVDRLASVVLSVSEPPPPMRNASQGAVWLARTSVGYRSNMMEKIREKIRLCSLEAFLAHAPLSMNSRKSPNNTSLLHTMAHVESRYKPSNASRDALLRETHTHQE